MKKIVLYLLPAITLIASCRKNDDHIFDKSPDERINETLQNYQAAITSAPNGWNGNLITGNGGTHRFYFSFNENNRVVMYSDFDSTTATEIKESSYRIKALQQPSLIFDTYSYIHILADPDASVNGGSYGAGLRSDFEFRIDTVTTDSISLTGRFHGSKLSLRKATAQDRTVWENKQVTTGVVRFRDFWKFLLYFKRLTYGSNQYELQFDSTVKRVTISWRNGNQTHSVSRGYYFWANGIGFTDPVVNGSQTVPGFTIVDFNAGSQIMNVMVNGTAATITGFNAPLNPDVRDAGTRWWQQGAAGDQYWVSIDGFHVNGVDDGYNLKSLKTDTSEYYFLLYKPNRNSIDAFFSIYLNPTTDEADVNHGSWLRMTSSPSTGRATFTEFEPWDNPFPATGPAAQTRAQMLNGNGYYFVQSSERTYDMVSVADAKIWLTWYWIW